MPMQQIITIRCDCWYPIIMKQYPFPLFFKCFYPSHVRCVLVMTIVEGVYCLNLWLDSSYFRPRWTPTFILRLLYRWFLHFIILYRSIESLTCRLTKRYNKIRVHTIIRINRNGCQNDLISSRKAIFFVIIERW